MIKDHEALCGCSMKSCSTCVSPTELNLFSVHTNHGSSVFHLLNSNWESPSKGKNFILRNKVNTCGCSYWPIHVCVIEIIS